MAKTPSYSDDKLLDAVIKYADVSVGKIKASALAAWASKHIEGMEGVRDYHFTRASTYTDPRTGKKIKKERPCMERIRDLNLSREISAVIKTNPLLGASDTGVFLKLPAYEQKEWILEARKSVDTMQKQIRALRSENRILRAENDDIKEKLNACVSSAEEIVRTQEQITKKASVILAAMNDEQCRKAMEKIGITKDGIRVSVFNASKRVEEQFSFLEAIQKMEQAIELLPEKNSDKVMGKSDCLRDQLFSGLDF